MGESVRMAASGAVLMQPVDVNQAITSLRLLGAERFDPIGLHYLEVLGSRTKAQNGCVKRILEAKLSQALDSFQQRFRQAQRDAIDAIAQLAPSYPQAIAELQELLDAGDFKAVWRLTNKVTSGIQCESLSGLARRIDEHSPECPEHLSREGVGSKVELKSVRQFRNTWSKLSANMQVTQALGQAPKNAGPINSHMLVLRSLSLMRDMSPDYLHRFVSYVDTLLSLDQVDKVNQDNSRVSTGNAKGRKPSSKGLRH